MEQRIFSLHAGVVHNVYHDVFEVSWSKVGQNKGRAQHAQANFAEPSPSRRCDQNVEDPMAELVDYSEELYCRPGTPSRYNCLWCALPEPQPGHVRGPSSLHDKHTSCDRPHSHGVAELCVLEYAGNTMQEARVWCYA